MTATEAAARWRSLAGTASVLANFAWVADQWPHDHNHVALIA